MPWHEDSALGAVSLTTIPDAPHFDHSVDLSSKLAQLDEVCSCVETFWNTAFALAPID